MVFHVRLPWMVLCFMWLRLGREVWGRDPWWQASFRVRLCGWDCVQPQAISTCARLTIQINRRRQIATNSLQRASVWCCRNIYSDSELQLPVWLPLLQKDSMISQCLAQIRIPHPPPGLIWYSEHELSETLVLSPDIVCNDFPSYIFGGTVPMESNRIVSCETCRNLFVLQAWAH